MKLSGGREVTGTLRGYDQLLNLVLDDAIEHVRDPEDAMRITAVTRRLGLMVCRGTSVMVVSALDGCDEISNPFLGEGGGGFVISARGSRAGARTRGRRVGGRRARGRGVVEVAFGMMIS